MKLNEFQDKAAKYAVYGKEEALEYTTLGLCGEAGELANKVKKIRRGDYTLDERRDDIVSELSDVLWYVSSVARALGVTLEDVAQYNLGKLQARLMRNVTLGDGDDR